MNQAAQAHDSDVVDYAISAYLSATILSDTIAARNRSNRMKINMECRRKLEIKLEELRLERVTADFDFN